MVEDLTDIKCPVCGTTLVTIKTDEEVKGYFIHKCGKCKRYWQVDYTNKMVTHTKGKVKETPIKRWILDLKTGSSKPLQHI